MPMTVNVGLTRKLGQPNFSSLGASCDVQLELDGMLLFANPDGLQEKIRAAYAACDRAITAELARQIGDDSPSSRDISGDRHVPANGYRLNNGGVDSWRNATTSQIRALHAIARRRGLNLTDILQDRFHAYSVERLSVIQASQLIDELNGTLASTTDGAEQLG